MGQKDECKGRSKAELLQDERLNKLGARELVAWDALEVGTWWSDKILSTPESCREGVVFREWLLQRPESRIAVVGHANKLSNMVKESSKPREGCTTIGKRHTAAGRQEINCW